MLSKVKNAQMTTDQGDNFQNSNNLNNRHTGIDFLRIISMMFVCVLHFLNYSEILTSSNFGSLEHISFWGLESLAFVAVNCFMLTSGYFLCGASFKLSRVFKFYAHILFFSIIGFVVYVVWGTYSIGLLDIRNIFLPISGVWWYVSCYFQILLIFPALNFLIDKMSKRQYSMLLFMGVIVCSIIPTLLMFNAENWTVGGSLMWYIFLYFVGAYIKKYDINISAKKSICFYLVSSLLLLASNIFIGYVTKFIFGRCKGETLFYNYNSIIVLISSVCLFLFFAKIRIDSKIIKKVAPLTFGVYLLHEHPYIRKWMFDYIAIKVHEVQPYMWLVYMILFVCVMFIVGCLLDFCFGKIYTLFRLRNVELKLDEIIHRHWGDKS